MSTHSRTTNTRALVGSLLPIAVGVGFLLLLLIGATAMMM
jgi:hypothetical protein